MTASFSKNPSCNGDESRPRGENHSDDESRPRGETHTIEPDSLTGVIFACEGIEGATVLLNGPTGCKYYHSAISDSQTFRQLEFDPLNFPMTWYFGQPRVPCTYLDNADYVYGSEAKLTDALEYFGKASGIGLLCIVNSPGAALIGDDLEGIAARHLGNVPYLTIETPGFSEGYCAGHERAARALIEKLAGDAPAVRARRVNVLGLSLYQRHYTGDVAELRRMLESMGLEVGCMLCAGCTLEEMRALSSASLNIVVGSELGLDTARFLEERFGTPYYVCNPLPIGFDATERMARDVAQLVEGDPGALLSECREARKRAFSYISRLNSLTGLPTGVPFAVEGTYSQLIAYTEFLMNYLGMVPVSLVPAFGQATQSRAALEELLAQVGLDDVLGSDLEQAAPELFFGSGSAIALLRLANVASSGVETMLPTLGYLDVVPKSHYGPTGALRIVESVLNGLAF